MTKLNIKREALRKPNQKRRKSCPFAAPNTPEIDYKDLKTLTRYVSERGKIIPSRISAVSSKRQRELLEGADIKSHEGMLYGEMYNDWKKRKEKDLKKTLTD